MAFIFPTGLFSKRSGQLTIDFVDFKIEPGLIYIMIPGQMRSWDYPDEIDGYAVNFSEIHFSESANAWRKLEEFPFFLGIVKSR
jgi:AraC family transcriptional regulator, transcriptional activator of pobA